MESRRGFAIQRLMNARRQAHADGWFIVFDTLTLADDRLGACYGNPHAMRHYFGDFGSLLLAADGRKANDSHASIGRAASRERVQSATSPNYPTPTDHTEQRSTNTQD